MFVNLHKTEEYNNKLHIVVTYWILLETFTLQSTLIVSFSPKFRYFEFKMYKNINTRTANESITNNSEIPRRQHG